MTQDAVDKAFDELHKACLESIRLLREIDPKVGSAEWGLLQNLLLTVQIYETSEQ